MTAGAVEEQKMRQSAEPPEDVPRLGSGEQLLD